MSEIPNSLKNPYALTISLNGTSQGPYDGSAAKNINITPSSIGAATSDHNHDGRYVRYYAVTTLDCNNLAIGLTAAGVSATNAAHTNHSAFLYISDVGTPFQIQIPDSSVPYIYKRYYSSGTWSGWFKLNAGYADSAGSASNLQTSRLLWGQPFDGTGDVDGTLRIRQTTSNWCEGIRIQNGDNTWATIILGATSDYGTNTNAWSIHRKDDNNFAISRNSSDGTNGLVMTSVGMGLGTTAPAYRLDVNGEGNFEKGIHVATTGLNTYPN